MILRFDQITFDAAHYLPGHPTCGGIHGHTYIIRDLTIDVKEMSPNKQGITIDFGEVKKIAKFLDHKFLVPSECPIALSTPKEIHDILDKWGIAFNICLVHKTSVEGIAAFLRDLLVRHFDLESEDCVHFTLLEGLNQGVSI